MKILEQNGIEIENIDGAAFNHFCAGARSGVVPGVLNECPVLSASNNSVTVGTGELLISGFRVKLTEATVFSFSVAPVTDTQYYIIGTIDVSSDRTVSFSMSCVTTDNLTDEDIFHTEQGRYQIEVGRFLHKTDGSITDVVKTATLLLNNALKIGSTIVTEQQIISLLNLLS